MPRYILSGQHLIDHIIPWGPGKEELYLIGGSGGYALSGMAMFTDDVIHVAYAGKDFEEFFGAWYRENGFSTAGVVIPYQQDGTYLPVQAKYGRNEPNMDLLGPWLDDPQLRGIHLLGHGNAVFFEQLSAVRSRGVKVGYEMGVMDGMYVDHDAFVKEITDRYIDYFSVSISEAYRLWPELKTEEDALAFFRGFGCAVFLRLGTKGAYMIEGGRAYFSPLVDAFGTVDPTGCGNSSTAAAFVSYCEGDAPLRSAYVGAVAASVTASYTGFVPKVDDALRRQCRALVDRLVEEAEGRA